MSDMREFDLLNNPLDGTNLVEASAGTGKTYSITGLLLRLVLEKGIPIEQILVVTYTEAATSELRDRIRKRLHDAATAFSGASTEDPFLLQIIARFPDRATALKKLNRAINDFDQASIFTIHGFCLRTLLDHAFASGVLLDTELVTNEELLLRETVRDFWRNHFYTTSPLFYNYARAKGLSPESLLKLTEKLLGNPGAMIIPGRSIPDCSGPEAEFRLKFETARKVWNAGKETITETLATHQGLNRRKYSPPEVYEWTRHMDGYLTGECLNCTPFDSFHKFTEETLSESMNKGKAAPAHPFFRACTELQQAGQRLAAAYDDRILGLKIELLAYVRTALEARKRQKNILFFDDLLLKLEKALSGPNGDHLAEIVRTRFKAALIDEFQDTDAIQYGIFDTLFGTPGSVLFLIGDPKQAIYGFRGADIFTYLAASRKTSFRFTLGENWRSEPSLITAVNTLFSASANPFIYDEIPFFPARLPAGKEHELLALNGKSEPPVQIWFVRASEEDAKPVRKGIARELTANAVAAETSRLLSLAGEGKALIGDRPLREGDIAVLVRTNREAGIVRKALGALSIHAVLYDVGNIFEGHEATEVKRVMAAVADPHDEALLRTALVTDMIGMSGEELGHIQFDDAGWDAWVVRFREYRDTWEQNGFFRMFRNLLSREKVLPRLMALTDGERRCTNMLHLAEVLHQAAVEEKLSMAGLVKWLSVQMDEDTPGKEEHQLRLESDANAVRIVTIHKSKGLEYPVVFCPFAWEGSQLGDPPFKFHDESAPDDPRTLDFGSAELGKHKAMAEKEELAENLRLLYVALTRARHRCYFVWGRINEGETSAPAWLFHFHPKEGHEALLESLQTTMAAMDADSMWKDLEEIRGKAGGTIGLSELPHEVGQVWVSREEPPPTVEARRFEGRIDRNWRITSFSSLVSNQPHRAEMADRDETVLQEAVPEEDTEETVPGKGSPDMFSFPRGTGAGILLHDIFEHLDFSSEDREAAFDLISDKLREHGFESCWGDPVFKMVQNVLAAPLDSDFGPISLSGVNVSDRLNELEFHFPLHDFSDNKLSEVLKRSAPVPHTPDDPSSFQGIKFQPVEGFMKGFIDLVFTANGRYYILDWKSNFLGATIESYNRQALRKAIGENLYDLQFTIYTLALHQYLKARMPGYSYTTHFGEVFYVFLRGVDPAKGSMYGIYKDRPAQDTIEALSSALVGGKDVRR